MISISITFLSAENLFLYSFSHQRQKLRILSYAVLKYMDLFLSSFYPHRYEHLLQSIQSIVQ